MPITIKCPACQVRSQVPETVSGRSVRCKKCGQKFTVQQTQAGSRSDTKSSQPTSSKDLFSVLPAEFGRYRLLSLLGQGGMGAVYLAEDTQLRRQVALKLPFFDTKESPQRAERFIREAQSAASLHHPNICTVFDTGRIDGRPFLTMAYIQGIGLDRMTDPDHLLPAPQVVDMIRKVALALAEAHSRGIVHRDLKPANIMLATSGEPVVMDFGLAKRSTDSDAADAKLTRDGGVIGTPSYMSPEQVRGDNSAIGAATDIYSLGVVLYELLAGRTPFVGGMGAVMGQILAAPVPPLTDFRPDANPQLDSICRTAMAKSPADRFASMLAFAQALSKYLTSESAISVELVETPVLRPPAPMVYVPTASTVPSVTAKKSLSQATAPAESFDQLTDSSPRKKRPTRKQIRNPWIDRGIAIGIALAILGPLAWFGVTLLRVETPNGTLIVEISDEEVEAKIKGGRLILSGQDGKERYTLSPTERNKKIDAGDYKIHVEGADGLTLDTPEFTLKKGDKVTVRVTLQKIDVTKVETKEFSYLEQLRRDSIPQELLKIAGGGDADKAPASLIGVIGKVAAGPPRAISSLAVSPDGKSILFSGDDGNMRKAALSGKGETQVLHKTPEPLNHMVISPDGKSIAEASSTATARDSSSLKAIFSVILWGTQTFAYSPDSKLLAGSDSAGIVHLWDLKLAKEVFTFPYLGRVNALTFSKDGKTLSAVSYEANCVRVWNVATGAEVSTWKNAFQNIIPLALRGVAFSSDLRQIATSHADGSITLWDAIKQEKIRTWAGHSGEVRTLKFTPDGRTLVSAAGDGTIRVWSVDQDRALEVIPIGPANQLLIFDIDPTGKYLFAAGQTPFVFILRLPEVVAEPQESIADPDRKAAEYVLSIGASLFINDDDEHRIRRTTDLPKQAFRLTCVWLNESPNVIDDGLVVFKQCKNLKKLYLYGQKNVTDAGMENFNNCKQITHLELFDTNITDVGLSHFKECRDLTWLKLESLKGVTSIGFSQLKNCNKLTTLHLNYTQVDDTGLRSLTGCSELAVVRLAGTPITDSGLANFKECKKLVNIQLNNTSITDAGLTFLHNCRNLSDVNLEWTKVTSKGVESLKKVLPKCTIHWKGPPEDAKPPAAPNVADFVPLFNGKDLTGWVVDGSGKKEEWKVADGAVSVAGGPRPTWGFLLTEKDYSDFLLKLQFQQKVEGAKTGIVIRGIPGQQFMNLPYQCKINLKLPDDTGALLWSSDSAYHKPTKRAQLKPAGEWNSLELELFGQNLRVMVNGDIVQDVKLDDLAGSPKSLAALKRQAGRIGLQKVEGDVAFRNIEIKELTAKKSAEPKPSEFVPLFNGKDLTGWKTHGSQPGNWRVEKGILIGASPNVSHLYTNRGDYTNFHLRIETRVNKNGNSGVNLRVPFGPASPGTKPQWVLGYNVKLDEKRLGGLLAGEDSSVHRDLVSTATLGEWMTLEIIATGNNVEVKINGVTTVTFQDPKKQYLSGHIALQQHTAGTVAEFRKIEIKELPAEPKDRGSLDADRKSAEYVLSIGGFVKVNDLNTEIRAVGDLPKEPFRLTFASLASNKVTDAGLVAFEGCTSLTFLEIRSIEVGDAGLAHFKDCQGLKYLCLYMTKVTNQGLSPFAHCKDLKVLVLAGCGRVGDAGLIHFKDCNEMTKIELPGTQVSDVGLAHFKNKPKMVELRLQGLAGVTDTGLSYFLGCDELKFVFLEGTKVTQEGKQNLKKKFSNIGFY